MKLTQEYRRVRANWGTDGDFITPEGKVIHVGENHTIFMMNNPEMFGGSEHPDDLVGQGWIQTRTIFGTFSINAEGGMNENQLHVLQKTVRERSRYSDPRIEVLMDDSSIYELTCDEFDEVEYPNHIKRIGQRSSSQVTSAFETVPKFSYPLAKDEDYGAVGYDAAFWVGPFEYKINFDRSRENPGENNYDVFFKVSNWKFSSDEEMVNLVSKIAKKPLDAREAKIYLIDKLRRYGITGLGDSRPILSGVIDAIKKFINMEKPDRLFFDAYEPKRRTLYEAILSNLKRNLAFNYTSEIEGHAMKFTVNLK